MIEIIGTELYQWDTGRSVQVIDTGATHVHFANTGDSKAVVMELTGDTVKVPDYLFQTGKQLCVYAVNNGVTVEKKVFAVRNRERPENYVYEDDQRNYIYELIQTVEEATAEAERVTAEAERVAAEFPAAIDKAVKSVTPDGIGAAPAGYGLGDTANMNAVESINSAVKPGWYKYLKSIMGLGNWTTRVDSDGESVYQTLKTVSKKGHPTFLRRNRIGGEWIVEWENPPLGVGSEYRTTARYQDKPVYTKLVNIGSFVPGKSVVVEAENPSGCIRCSASAAGMVLPLFSSGAVHAGVNVMPCDAGFEIIMVGDNNSVANNRETKVQLWYTK